MRSKSNERGISLYFCYFSFFLDEQRSTWKGNRKARLGQAESVRKKGKANEEKALGTKNVRSMIINWKNEFLIIKKETGKEKQKEFFLRSRSLFMFFCSFHSSVTIRNTFRLFHLFFSRLSISFFIFQFWISFYRLRLTFSFWFCYSFFLFV